MHMNAIAEPEEVSTLTEPDDSWATVVATVGRIETSLNLWLSQSHGLGLTDYRALALLSEAPDRELRISELAIRIGLNQSSTTRLVGRLELKGLVTRDTCPEDGRGVYAVITETGLDLTHELTTSYSEKLTKLLTTPPTATTSSTANRAFRTIADLTP